MRLVVALSGIALAIAAAPSGGTPPATQPAAPEQPQSPSEAASPEPQLKPITAEAGLGRIYSRTCELAAESLRHRAAVREYARQIRQIRHKHFGPIKAVKMRSEGLAQLSEFTDRGRGRDGCHRRNGTAFACLVSF